MANLKLASILGRSVEPKTAELSTSRDEFSVRVTAKGDPIYWVRVEPRESGRCLVTDFNPGSQSESDLNRGIEAAVREACGDQLKELVFVNLVPGDVDSRSFAFRLEKTAELLRRVCDGLGKSYGVAVKAFAIQEVRGRFNLTVEFAPG